MIAHDVYAETNPAFGAYVLLAFTRGFAEANPVGLDLPVAYLGLPILLSGDLSESFDATNRTTSLGMWLERSPQIQLGLAERLNDALDIVTEAVRLGCFSGILALEAGARLSVGPLALKKDLSAGLSQDLMRTIRHADRLGYWFAAAGSTKTAYDMMGLTL